MGWHNNCENLLADPNRCLLMCEAEDGTSVAVVRFDIEEGRAELSINLSPIQRGKGLAPKCLSLAIEYFGKHYPAVSELVAKIKTINLPSRRSFEHVGFFLREENEGFWYLSAEISA